MRATLHAASEGVSLEAHTDSSHLSSSEAGLNHHVAPLVHPLLPVDEAGRDDLRDVLGHFGRAFANGPEEPPLGIELGRELGLGHVLGGKLVKNVLVVACTLLSLWSNTCLEVVLWFAVIKLLSCVMFAGLKLEVLLHHIKVVFVVLLFDAGISEDEDTELVERLGDKFALLLSGGGVFLVEEGADVNDWDFR